MTKLAEFGGARFPFLRWSVLRMMLGARHLLTHWQVEHDPHVEYQMLLEDLVLESEYLGRR
jgi:hypothetical protein